MCLSSTLILSAIPKAPTHLRLKIKNDREVYRKLPLIRPKSIVYCSLSDKKGNLKIPGEVGYQQLILIELLGNYMKSLVLRTRTSKIKLATNHSDWGGTKKSWEIDRATTLGDRVNFVTQILA